MGRGWEIRDVGTAIYPSTRYPVASPAGIRRWWRPCTRSERISEYFHHSFPPPLLSYHSTVAPWDELPRIIIIIFFSLPIPCLAATWVDADSSIFSSLHFNRVGWWSCPLCARRNPFTPFRCYWKTSCGMSLRRVWWRKTPEMYCGIFISVQWAVATLGTKRSGIFPLLRILLLFHSRSILTRNLFRLLFY